MFCNHICLPGNSQRGCFHHPLAALCGRGPVRESCIGLPLTLFGRPPYPNHPRARKVLRFALAGICPEGRWAVNVTGMGHVTTWIVDQLRQRHKPCAKVRTCAWSQRTRFPYSHYSRPRYASCLNSGGACWFGIITQRANPRGKHLSIKELIAKSSIHRRLQLDQAPFSWTA